MRAISALAVLFVTAVVPVTAFAQAPEPTAQKEAMAKLSYWAGTWKGKGTAVIGPGQQRETEVTEKIESKVSGLVLYIEGLGTTLQEDGKMKVTHDALGVVWYDPAAKQYRIKTFVMQGFTMESELKPSGDGFEWGFKYSDNGPTLKYTIHNRDGKWNEVGEMSMDGKTWRKIFEMNLKKQEPEKQK